MDQVIAADRQNPQSLPPSSSENTKPKLKPEITDVQIRTPAGLRSCNRSKFRLQFKSSIFFRCFYRINERPRRSLKWPN
jgi:hypothetical protein